jgi:hypothetical protein
VESRQLIAGGAYGPEALKVIGEAFDEAWRDIASNLGDPDIETARNRLARAILSIADDDSRDVSVLRQAAGFQRLRTAIPIDCGQSFRSIADSIPAIADRQLPSTTSWIHA